MSRIKLLLDVVTDMRTLADSLQVLADAIASDEDRPLPQPAPEPSPFAAPVPKEEAPLAEDAPDAKAPTLEEVRKVLAGKSRSGYTAEIRALLQKHGADKLSAVNPSDYAALLAEAEELDHAE